MATPDAMRAELDRLARKLEHVKGIRRRYWSINSDAGTVSDPNTGEWLIYVSHELLDRGLEKEV